MTDEGRRKLDELRIQQGLDPGEPWGGRSPRVLTRAHQEIRLSLRDDDVNAFSPEEDARLEEQCRRHFHGS